MSKEPQKKTTRKPRQPKTPAETLQTPKSTESLYVDYYLRRVAEVRSHQLEEGNFDCFAKAWDGYCDQGDCSFRDECFTLSKAKKEF